MLSKASRAPKGSSFNRSIVCSSTALSTAGAAAAAPGAADPLVTSGCAGADVAERVTARAASDVARAAEAAEAEDDDDDDDEVVELVYSS